MKTFTVILTNTSVDIKMENIYAIDEKDAKIEALCLLQRPVYWTVLEVIETNK